MTLLARIFLLHLVVLTSPYASAIVASITQPTSEDPALNERTSTDEGVSDGISGFLGSTSLSDVFKASKNISDDIWTRSLTNARRSMRAPANDIGLSDDQVNSSVAILNLLSDYEHLNKTIERYYHFSQTVTIPWVTLKKSLDSVVTTLRDDYPSERQRRILVKRIFAKTITPLRIDAAMTAEAFHESFTGPNLRWEILGLIFTYFALGNRVSRTESKLPHDTVSNSSRL